MMERTYSSCTYEEGLRTRVVEAGRCCRCGTCGAVCPKHRDRRRHTPLAPAAGLAAPNEPCTLCTACCPREAQRTEEGLGTVVGAWAARARNGHRADAAQDGGACTAFLASLEGYRPATVGACGWEPRPTIEDPPHATAGSKYAATASLSLLPQPRDRLAFVGLPCQMTGITLAQERGLLGEVALKVGLFCTKVFDHAVLAEVLAERGIVLSEVVRMDIKSALVLTGKNGSSESVPLRSLGHAVVEGCAQCADFCAWHADIAFGSVGSPEGWTTVIARTPHAEALFLSAAGRNYLKLSDEIDLTAVSEHQERKRRSSMNGQAHHR